MKTYLETQSLEKPGEIPGTSGVLLHNPFVDNTSSLGRNSSKETSAILVQDTHQPAILTLIPSRSHAATHHITLERTIIDTTSAQKRP